MVEEGLFTPTLSRYVMRALDFITIKKSFPHFRPDDDAERAELTAASPVE